MIKRAIILLIICIWTTSAIAEQRRYVSPAGIDTVNSCTNAEAPCGSIKHAIGQANDGDLIDIADGIYTEEGIMVDKSILIQGKGSDETVIQAAHTVMVALDRVLSIPENVTVTIADLTIRHGKSPSAHQDIPGGGGILNFGELTINNTKVTNNTTGIKFGGDNTVSSDGGGIANFGSLTLNYSTVSYNSTGFVFDGISGFGGGIFNLGTLRINYSSVSNNVTEDGLTSGQGGGIANGGLVIINNSCCNNNRTGNTTGNAGTNPSGHGGGIYSPGGTIMMNNCTVSGNHTGQITGDGGIPDNSEINNGGGLFSYGDIIIQNSTIVNNNADNGNGGGIWISIGKLEMGNTILAGNIINNGHGADCLGVLTSKGYNLIGDTNGCNINGDQSGNILDIAPKISSLEKNGGPTKTHALMQNSPAIDAGDLKCVDLDGIEMTIDQRGQPRPVDGDGDKIATCDIGAFEFLPDINELVMLEHDPKTAFDPTPVPNGPAGTFTITATFTNISSSLIQSLFFVVRKLSGHNILLNADEDTTAMLTPDVDGEILIPGKSITQDFIIGLQDVSSFTLYVYVFGIPEL